MKAAKERARKSAKDKARRTFAQNLRRACKRRRITPSTLAVRSGQSLKRIERLLAGEREPNLRLANQIARSIRVPLTELVEGL